MTLDFRTLLLAVTVAIVAPFSPISMAVTHGTGGNPAKSSDSPDHRDPSLSTDVEAGDAPDSSGRQKSTPKAHKASRASARQAKKHAKHHITDAELRCLALNIYHEARSESVKGQEAVAAVTLNRVKSKAFPSSVCKVVKQGSQKRHQCQFSWWCDGRSDRPTEKAAWSRALKIGREALLGLDQDPTGGALYYHTKHVRPKWSRKFLRTAKIGHHIFYKPVKRKTLKLASAS